MGAHIHCSLASSREIFQGLYSVVLMLVQGVLTPFGLSVFAAVRRKLVNGCSCGPLPDLPLCTSQTGLAVMQRCTVSDRQQGCFSNAYPPPLPQSDGSASVFHNESVAVRLMQANSCSLGELAIRES